MERSEAGQLLTLMASAWPRFEPSDDKVALWRELFDDVPFEVAKLALKKLMLTNTFPPSVAELRQAVMDITTPESERITAAEAWGMVSHAIRDYGSYREREGLESLPPVVRKTAEYIGWRELCLSEEGEILRAQFMRMFQQVSERRREEVLLPPAVRELIGKLAGGMDMSKKVDKRPELKLVSGKGGPKHGQAQETQTP